MKNIILGVFLLTSTILLSGCNSDDGEMVVYQDFTLKSDSGDEIKLQAGNKYQVYVTPYSIFGSDFYARFYNHANAEHVGLAKFDIEGFRVFPLEGDFESGIHNQMVSLKGESRFEPFASFTQNVVEDCEPVENQPLQRRKVTLLVKQGYRKVQVQIMNPSRTQVLAVFSYNNRFDYKETLNEGVCF